MEDEKFCKQLCEFVATAGSVDELDLDRWIRKESSRIDHDCVTGKINISFAGLDFFYTDEQRHNLIAGLQGPTIHGYGRLMDCVQGLSLLPIFYNLLQRRGQRYSVDSHLQLRSS